MKWQNIKVINVKPNGTWWKSHMSAPVPFLLNNKIIRVLFGAFDEFNVARIAYVDLDIDTFNIINVSEKPILDLGKDGTFDDNGVHPMGIVKKGDLIYLYYTGYQLLHKVPYSMFAGVALSKDGGYTFSRIQDHPIMDRSCEGLCTRGGPTGFVENGVFKLWYAAGTDWITLNGKLRPTYNVFYQESIDGIVLKPNGHLCIKYDKTTEHGLGRPVVLKANNHYVMFHTVRTLNMKYSIGFATSKDGYNWTRRDSELGLKHGNSGWNSDMIYFPYLLQVGSDFYLFYNGNSFGLTGIGIEKLIDWEF